MASQKIKVGIIGGSGFNDPKLFQQTGEKEVTTPFGKPSDKLILGEMSGVECVLLPRHGKGHKIPPSKINYRANIYALKQEGCTHVVATSACGGLQEHTAPGNIIIVDQFIDRTTRRVETFYDNDEQSLDGVLHIPMAEPFCTETRKCIIQACRAVGGRQSKYQLEGEAPAKFTYHEKGTTLIIEGPRFSSRAESLVWHAMGADVVNMTTVPEVILAKEAGLSYGVIAIVTDYDSWRPGDNHVSVQEVVRNFMKSIDNVKLVLAETISIIGKRKWDDVLAKNQELVANSRQDEGAQKK